MRDNKKLFVVVIIHQHGNDFSSTVGKIRARDLEDVERRSEMWLARKRKEHRCKELGNACYAYIDEPNRSLKTVGIDGGAEEIDPTASAS